MSFRMHTVLPLYRNDSIRHCPQHNTGLHFRIVGSAERSSKTNEPVALGDRDCDLTYFCSDFPFNPSTSNRIGGKADDLTTLDVGVCRSLWLRIGRVCLLGGAN